MSASGPSDPVAFDRQSAARIAEVVRRSERGYRNPPPRRPRYPITADRGLIPFRTIGTDGIAAGSPETPSSATVNLLTPKTDGSKGFQTLVTATVWNPYPSAVGTNGPAFGWCCPYNNTYYVVTAGCS